MLTERKVEDTHCIRLPNIMQGRLQAGEFVSYLPKGRDGDIEAMHNTGKRFRPPFV